MIAARLLAASGKGPNPILPSVTEMIVGLIAFAVLYFVLRARVFPIFERIFAERRDAIEGGLERAERAQQEAQQALEQYRSQLAEARAEAARIREQAHDDGRRIREEIRAESETEREERKTRFDEQLEAERAQAVAALRREIGAIALQLAERIVAHDIERDERQRQLVDDFIAGLDSQPAGVGASGPGS